MRDGLAGGWRSSLGLTLPSPLHPTAAAAGYMTIVSATFFCLTGTIGFYATYFVSCGGAGRAAGSVAVARSGCGEEWALRLLR